MAALVSIVIPTYNSLHLRECLDSVAVQDRDDVECIVVDDGSDLEFLASIEATVAAYDFATLVRNQTRLGPRRNFLHCLTIGTGLYVKVLQHDDVLLPGAIDLMVCALDENPSAVMATSAMQLIDVSGELLPEQWWSAPIVQRDALIDGRELVAWTIEIEGNPIGAPAASLIRRTAIDSELLEFATEGVERAFDVAAWMAIAPQGDVAYIAAPQSSFRLHATSLSGQSDLGFHLAADWGAITERALALGVMSPEELAHAWKRYFPRVTAAATAAGGDHPLATVLSDRVELARSALLSGALVCAVLCDGVTERAVETARDALSVADVAVVLDRASASDGVRSGVQVFATDWEDPDALAATLSRWPDAPVLLLVEGEHVECQSALRARAALAAIDCVASSAVVSCDGVFDDRLVRLSGPAGVADLSTAVLSISTRMREKGH